MTWYRFDPARGSRQKRPPIKKHVLVVLAPTNKYQSGGVAVGYRKDGAGDKQSPYFVIPGIGHTPGPVVAWCDCLPEGFEWPKEIIEPILAALAVPSAEE